MLDGFSIPTRGSTLAPEAADRYGFDALVEPELGGSGVKHRSRLEPVPQLVPQPH